jgi:hypothetical protein
MSNLPAGGLRSPRIIVAAPGEDARASGLGTDPANGLEFTQRQYARPNTRRTGKTVLRSESRSIRQVERGPGKTSGAAGAEVLRSEGILLGSSDSLRTRSPLDRCALVNILGWSSCESYSGVRENDYSPTLMTAKN